MLGDFRPRDGRSRSARARLIGVLLLGALLALLAADEVPSAASPDGRASLGNAEHVLQLPWGDCSACAGRVEANESAAEGPMSFTVTAQGEIYLLDQANGRILVFSENTTELLREVPLRNPTAQDLEVAPNGRILLLDTLVRRSLSVLEPDGTLVREVPVEGGLIQQSGFVTAMFLRDDGVWLEVSREGLVRMLDAKLEPADQILHLGRFTADQGVAAFARLDRRGGAELLLRNVATGAETSTQAITLDRRIGRIAWLEADANGRLLLLVHLFDTGPAKPGKLEPDENRALLFDRNLQQLGTFRVPWVVGEYEQFREFKLLPDGTLYQMSFSAEGANIRRWRVSP